MDERSFEKFLFTLGISLLLIGNVAVFALGHYGNQVLAGDVLPFIFCEKNEDGTYILTGNASDLCADVTDSWSTYGDTDCNVLEDPAKRQGCNDMKDLLQRQANGCSFGGSGRPFAEILENPYPNYVPLSPSEVGGLCQIFGL